MTQETKFFIHSITSIALDIQQMEKYARRVFGDEIKQVLKNLFCPFHADTSSIEKEF